MKVVLLIVLLINTIFEALNILITEANLIIIRLILVILPPTAINNFTGKVKIGNPAVLVINHLTTNMQDSESSKVSYLQLT
jgi:hypothetical protein